MRLFIAIKFTDEILDALTDYQQALRACGVTGNYSKRENLHITLAFIGEYDDPNAVLDAIDHASFRPAEVRLEGVGHFGDLLWAGLAENPGLAAYVKRLRKELSAREIPFDKKKFSPHVTLVRKASRQGANLLPAPDPPQGSMLADHVALMRSERGKQGMIYTEISTGG